MVPADGPVLPIDWNENFGTFSFFEQPSAKLRLAYVSNVKGLRTMRYA
jgi:hypothetical protein